MVVVVVVMGIADDVDDNTDVVFIMITIATLIQVEHEVLETREEARLGCIREVCGTGRLWDNELQ